MKSSKFRGTLRVSSKDLTFETIAQSIMEDPLFTDEKKAEYKKEADEKTKEAVDSLMNLILQLSPTSHSQPDMRGRVEAAVNAILDAAIARFVQYNSEATLEDTRDVHSELDFDL